MKKIFKYPIPIQDHFAVQMPIGAKVLCVQVQHGNPYIWVIVDERMPITPYQFRLRGTGHNCTDCDESRYVGTFQLNDGYLIFHLFGVGELTENPVS